MLKMEYLKNLEVVRTNIMLDFIESICRASKFGGNFDG